jgi:hypothetical protein
MVRGFFEARDGRNKGVIDEETRRLQRRALGKLSGSENVHRGLIDHGFSVPDPSLGTGDIEWDKRAEILRNNNILIYNLKVNISHENNPEKAGEFSSDRIYL